MVQEPVALALALYRNILVLDAGSSRMVVVQSI